MPRLLKGADLTFVSGEGLESWFERLVTASGYSGKPIVASRGIKTRTMEEDGKTVTDPHVWNSPVNVEVWVANIEKALASADPDDAAVFKANAAQYTRELKDLHTYAKSVLETVPKDRRKILTSHNAFGYFGREYGVTFLSPVGLSTETEASAAGVAKLIDQMKKERVKTYFFENSNRVSTCRSDFESDRRATRGRTLCRVVIKGRGSRANIHQDVPLQRRPAIKGDGRLLSVDPVTNGKMAGLCNQCIFGSE